MHNLSQSHSSKCRCPKCRRKKIEHQRELMAMSGGGMFPQSNDQPARDQGFEFFETALLDEFVESEVNRNSRDYIRWVQQALNQIMGMRLVVDGISGPQTRSAVRSFQQQRGLLVDGIVGPQTEAALKAAIAGNPPGVISSPSQPSPGATTSARWVLPPDVRASGESQFVRYDSPPPWDNGKSCTGSLTLGAAELRDYIRATFRGVRAIGGYNCRQNTGNLAQTSVHGTGRALDIMIPLVNKRANSSVGDPIANWLVQNAKAIGVQYIIWKRSRWSGSRSGRKDGSYGGPSPHIDHIHVELNRDGAARATPWFASRTQRSRSGEIWAAEINHIQEEIDPETSDHVEWLQRSLNHVLGLRLPEDGVLGPATRSALRSFQRQRGLDTSGALNLRTERSLMATGAGPHRHPKRG